MEELEERSADQILQLAAEDLGRARVDPDDAFAREDVQAGEALIEQEGETVGGHREWTPLFGVPCNDTARTAGRDKATCAHGHADSLRPCARSSATRTRSHFPPGTASRCPSTACCASASSTRACSPPASWRSRE